MGFLLSAISSFTPSRFCSGFSILAFVGDILLKADDGDGEKDLKLIGREKDKEKEARKKNFQ